MTSAGFDTTTVRFAALLQGLRHNDSNQTTVGVINEASSANPITLTSNLEPVFFFPFNF